MKIAVFVCAAAIVGGVALMAEKAEAMPLGVPVMGAIDAQTGANGAVPLVQIHGRHCRIIRGHRSRCRRVRRRGHAHWHWHGPHFRHYHRHRSGHHGRRYRPIRRYRPRVIYRY
ncbi:MAG: hypothetical protein AAFQ10_07000 [Pseudomonadota bacterium]